MLPGWSTHTRPGFTHTSFPFHCLPALHSLFTHTTHTFSAFLLLPTLSYTRCHMPIPHFHRQDGRNLWTWCLPDRPLCPLPTTLPPTTCPHSSHHHMPTSHAFPPPQFLPPCPPPPPPCLPQFTLHLGLPHIHSTLLTGFFPAPSLSLHAPLYHLPLDHLGLPHTHTFCLWDSSHTTHPHYTHMVPCLPAHTHTHTFCTFTWVVFLFRSSLLPAITYHLCWVHHYCHTHILFHSLPYPYLIPRILLPPHYSSYLPRCHTFTQVCLSLPRKPWITHYTFCHTATTHHVHLQDHVPHIHTCLPATVAVGSPHTTFPHAHTRISALPAFYTYAPWFCIWLPACRYWFPHTHTIAFAYAPPPLRRCHLSYIHTHTHHFTHHIPSTSHYLYTPWVVPTHPGHTTIRRCHHTHHLPSCHLFTYCHTFTWPATTPHATPTTTLPHTPHTHMPQVPLPCYPH